MKKEFKKVSQLEWKYPYDILIGDISNNLLKNFPEIKDKKILVITDSNVEKLYLNDLLKMLKQKGYSANFHTILAGEQYKNLEQINLIYKACVAHGLDRDSLIITLGGGVVGDMAGFVAATYLRGINFVQIPTTLLAQVDASIGGKTGIDLEFGKNLVGAFHQPKLVWIDPNFLKSLDDREFKNGLAEVIKYGVIYSKEYWDFMYQNIDKILSREDDILLEIIKMCILAKSNIVLKDEKEKKLRKILNFGHTLGHALETSLNYNADLKHGVAVAVGMAFASFVSVQMNLCDKSLEINLINLLEKIDFRLNYWKQKLLENNQIDKIIKIMSLDKKKSEGKLDFILIENLGKCKIVPLELEFIKQMLIEWKINKEVIE